MTIVFLCDKKEEMEEKEITLQFKKELPKDFFNQFKTPIKRDPVKDQFELTGKTVNFCDNFGNGFCFNLYKRKSDGVIGIRGYEGIYIKDVFTTEADFKTIQIK